MGPSLALYATAWIASRAGLATRTRETYEFLLLKFILPEMGERPLSAISPADVRMWHARHASVHPSSAAKSYRLLSAVMRTAVVDGVIPDSPCRVRGAGTERAAERPVATVLEVHRLRLAMPRHLHIAVDLAVWCQLRRGEILGLERRDVDLIERTVRIARSRTFLTTGESHTRDTKSRAGRRTIAVPSVVMDRLTSHLEQFVDEPATAPVLIGHDARPISAAALQRAWSAARGTIDRSDLHFHDLRHTGLTLAAATGATTSELMRRAGHASPAAALRYQHATLERDRALASLLGEIAADTQCEAMEGAPLLGPRLII